MRETTPRSPLAAGSDAPPSAGLVVRSGLGGVLMGLANLVPGISGGTMLLAAGVYPDFIHAIAETTTLRFRRRSLVVLSTVVVAAGLAILLLAGPLKDLVVHHRWIMYSLFVGLTLGGIPAVWQLAVPAGRAFWVGSLGGMVLMVLLTLGRQLAVGGTSGGGWPMLLVAGLAGASAMILPGVSGGFLLLLLGQYVPILSAIDRFEEALRSVDLAAALDPAISVLLPVGIGVGIGVVAVSNALRWLLVRHPQATLGVLMGFLLGAVIGLWPFQQGVEPVVGETVVKGQVVSEEMLAELDPEDYPTELFSPSLAQVILALSLVGIGGAGTVLLTRLGSTARAELDTSESPATD